MVRDFRIKLNRWLWYNLGFKRKQFPLKIEAHKKSRKGMLLFWAGVALGYMPYIIHQMGWLR